MNLVENTALNQDFTLLEKMSEHEQVIFCQDPATKLRAIIAIHDTTLGPALGGCRMYPYPNLEAALEDVLRLSKGMTFKCAAADVDFGGGKAVIIGNPQTDKSPELFRAFGQFVESLGGRFYTGTDMGTTMDDFIHALKETRNIVGVPASYGGGGDSSVPTAAGVIYGIKATNYVLFGTNDLHGVTYAIQGLGKVGYKIAEKLLEEGADLFVTDINEELLLAIQNKAKESMGSVQVVGSEEIYSVEADIFVPCALGGIINEQTIPLLKTKAVAGSANNQLLTEDLATQLTKRGILYAPDYMINSGGLIQVADELYGANQDRVMHKTKEIYHTILNVYRQAEVEQITTLEAANRLCTQRIAARARRNSFFTHSVKPKWDFPS